MVVKGAAFRAVDVGTVSVEAVVGRRLTFSYVLAVVAEGAVAQVYAVTTFAIKVVLDLEGLLRLMACECLARGDDAAAFVLCVA